ncbi:hypothetical protein ACTFIR_006743 [Dictyostelium discoideum]
MDSSYNYRKLICLQNSSDDHNNNKIKQQNFKRLFSEFKNVLEFKTINDDNNNNNNSNNNNNNNNFEETNDEININIIKSLTNPNEEKEITNKQLLQIINSNKSIEKTLNKYKDKIINYQFNDFINKENKSYPIVYFSEIQLFLIQNIKNLNWYFYNNNNNNNENKNENINNNNDNNNLIPSIAITILISLNNNNNEIKTFINYQIGSFKNNNNYDNGSFMPNELKKTFNELSDYYYIVNKSFNKCCLEFIKYIRNHEYQGTFEIHVSVDSKSSLKQLQQEEEKEEEEKEQQLENNNKYIQEFKEFCKENKLKSILIELSKGEFSNQMMTSSHHHSDNLFSVQLKAYEIAFNLLVKGYNVSRLKIEILASCTGVPDSIEKHLQLSPSNYFEFHIKLLLPILNNNNENNYNNNNNEIINGNLNLLKEIMNKHNGHLSRNSFRISLDEKFAERFVTLRMYSIGRDIAIDRFESCKNELLFNNFKISTSHREYSIYDSNINLDIGWIE